MLGVALRIILLFLLLIIFSGSVFSISVNNIKLYTIGEIRVFYSNDINSKYYIVNQKDENNNKIPDYVENIAIQANATIDIFSALGLIKPLDNSRYKKVVKYIDIHLVDTKYNGLAYEMPTLWKRSNIKGNRPALLILVNHNLKNFPGNYWTTVTHELFHLYQYGYSQFKGGWYLEGMANWSERALRLGAVGRGGDRLLPQNEQELQQVFNTSYNHLWHRLAILSDTSNGKLEIPKSLLNRTYVDGTKVFKDDQWKGYRFMKKFLENLEIMSNRISVEKKRDPYFWSEKDQISKENRKIILKVIQQTMLEFDMNKTDEERNFLRLKVD